MKTGTVPNGKIGTNKSAMFLLALAVFQIKEIKGVFLPEDAPAHAFGRESQYPSALRSRSPFLSPYYLVSIPYHLTNIRNEGKR